MPPVLHREALYLQEVPVKPAGADVWKGRLWICGSPYQRLRRDSLRLVRGSLEGDRFEQRTTGRLALPKGTDLRRVSMCSHEGDLHVFVAAAWLKRALQESPPSRTWTSRCDRYCSGFSEFIRPWRGSRAAEWFLPFGDALGDHVTKERAVLVRECARRTVGVDQREAYWLMGSLFDGAPRK